MSMRIKFISNFDLADRTGGWNGINYQLFSALQKRVDIQYVGPVNPGFVKREKYLSAFLRRLGLRGKFAFYSDRRLSLIQRQVMSQVVPGDHLFFFGATPWVTCKPMNKYHVYLDICFPGYIDLYSKRESFIPKDLERISLAEKGFLEKAEHIFWGSSWAREQAESVYGVRFEHSTVISTGGYVSIPESPGMSYQKKLVFISLDFEKKGGRLAFEVFERIRESVPGFTFVIIGQKPPEEILRAPGVKYLGRLRKEVPSELEAMEEELRTAFFLIHPTIMDTMGAVIVEAGYFGTPAIAPNNFGIPDLVTTYKTGVLVDLPLTVEKFADPIIFFARNEQQYIEMRKSCYAFMTGNRTWQVIAEKVAEKISL